MGQDTIDVFDLVHEASRRPASVETRTRILLSDTNALALHLGVGRYVLSTNATSPLLATIHKGNSLLPTGRDTEITDRMKKMAAVLAFKLLEHVIFCPASSHYSFKLSSEVGRSMGWPDKLTLPALIKQLEVRGVGGPVMGITGFAEDSFSTLFVNTELEGAAEQQNPERGPRNSHKLTTLSDAELLDILFDAASRSNAALAARMTKLHVSFARILT